MLWPNSTSASEGILKRSMACTELCDMKENNPTRQRPRKFRLSLPTKFSRSMK
jgi:hypothetical protein